jgi:site-specific recombinase
LYSAEYAEKTILSLHPFKSLSIPYAALTGILLWVSSIGAGWLENWFVYRRLHETITQSAWLTRLFGEKRAVRVSNWICQNVSGIGGNVSLGFLLAFTPITGRFFGLPLGVAHVTLSTAALTFAFCALPDWRFSSLALAALSILLIGLLNFGVSFAAALFTAVKARRVKKARLALLRSSLWVKFRLRPLDFIFPRRAEIAEQTTPAAK